MNFILLVIEWNPDPVIIQLGNISIKWYGLMYSIALISCYALGYYFFKKDGLPLHRLLNLALLLFVSGIVGARLGQIIFYDTAYFVNNPNEIFKIWKGGMASHGAFLLIVLAWYFYTLKNNIFNFWWGMDKLAIMGALIVSLMRFGNLINSEIIGKPTELPWGFIFTKHDLIPRHPVVLYEAIAYSIFFVFFLWMDHYFAKLKTGTLTCFFLLLLVPTRVLLEQLKESAQFSQLLSMLLVILGLFILVLLILPKKLKVKS